MSKPSRQYSIPNAQTTLWLEDDGKGKVELVIDKGTATITLQGFEIECLRRLVANVEKQEVKS